MILKKINDDGKEAFERISYDEAIKLKKDELVFTTDDDEDEYDDYLEEKGEEEIEEAGEKFKDLSKNERYDHLKNVLDETKEKIFDRLNDSKNKRTINEDGDINIDFDIPHDRKGMDIYMLLPFLDEEKVDEIVKDKLNGNEKYKDLRLALLLPFMSNDAIDELFMNCLKDETKKDELIQFAPFVSERVLDYLCDEYCKGNFEFLNINGFYPFMSDESINKLFEYFLKQQ